MVKTFIVTAVTWFALLQVPPPVAPWVMIMVAVITAIPASIVTAIVQDRIAKRQRQAQEHISVTEAAESILESADRARARYEKGLEDWYQREVGLHTERVQALEAEHNFHLERIRALEAEVKRLTDLLNAVKN